jgi:hypothetical protein
MRIPQTPLRQSRRAAVAVQVALTMTVLLGMLAIVVDGGLLLAQRRQQQACADAAAMAYAAAMADGKTIGQAQASALAIASANGAANDGTISKIIANTTDAGGNPVHGIWDGPVSGNFVGRAGTTGYATGYVEVVVEYDAARLFSSIWDSSTLPVRARAVASWAGLVPTYWTPSILALGATGTDITDAGTAQITVPGDIISNASIKVTGGKAEVTSTNGKIYYAQSESGSNYSPVPTYRATPTDDPLATVSPPDPATLPTQNVKMPINATTTLQPGVYPGGISITGGTVTLSPGIYYMESGGLSIQGGSTVVTDNGSGVLIYNGETSGATNNPGSVGAITLNAGGVLQITPMTSGTWQGISLFQDRNATQQSQSIIIDGGNNTNIAGMIYAPGSEATIAGNATIVPGTSFITKTLKVAGTSAFTIPNATVKVPIPGSGSGGSVAIVE